MHIRVQKKKDYVYSIFTGFWFKHKNGFIIKVLGHRFPNAYMSWEYVKVKEGKRRED